MIAEAVGRLAGRAHLRMRGRAEATAIITQPGAVPAQLLKEARAAGRQVHPLKPRYLTMRIVVTGSIAYDYLMSFPGKFTEHFLPEHMIAGQPELSRRHDGQAARRLRAEHRLHAGAARANGRG